MTSTSGFAQMHTPTQAHYTPRDRNDAEVRTPAGLPGAWQLLWPSAFGSTEQEGHPAERQQAAILSVKTQAWGLGTVLVVFLIAVAKYLIRQGLYFACQLRGMISNGGRTRRWLFTLQPVRVQECWSSAFFLCILVQTMVPHVG